MNVLTSAEERSLLEVLSNPQKRQELIDRLTEKGERELVAALTGEEVTR